MQKHNEHVFTYTLGPTFIFKAMDINHQWWPWVYKLSNDPSTIVGLHYTIQIKNMLVELCVGNNTMYDGLVNGIDGIKKTSTTYCDKTNIWIIFQNFKIGTLTRENKIIITTTLNQNGHQLNLSSKI